MPPALLPVLSFRASSLSSHCAQLQAPLGHSLSLGGVRLSREGGGGLKLQQPGEGEGSSLLRSGIQPLYPLFLPKTGLHPKVQPFPHPSPFPQAPGLIATLFPEPCRPGQASTTEAQQGQKGHCQAECVLSTPQAGCPSGLAHDLRLWRRGSGWVQHRVPAGIWGGGWSLGLEEGRKGRTKWRGLESGVGDGEQVGLRTREGLGLGPSKALGVGWQGRAGGVWGGVRGGAVGREGPGRPSAYLQPGGDSEWKVERENISARSAIFSGERPADRGGGGVPGAPAPRALRRSRPPVLSPPPVTS